MKEGVIKTGLEKALEELEIESVESVQELIDDKAIIPFSFAIELALEGHVVKPVGENYQFTIREIDFNGKKEPQICIVDDKGDVMSFISSFTKEDIFAEYNVVK